MYLNVWHHKYLVSFQITKTDSDHHVAEHLLKSTAFLKIIVNMDKEIPDMQTVKTNFRKTNVSVGYHTLKKK